MYSPERRTALVLCGTGAHGAYHAGVLRALQEVGVKIDVLAGHGIGAAGAAVAAIDGAARLAEPDGIWRGRGGAAMYGWRTRLVAAAALGLAAPIVLAIGLLFVALRVPPSADPRWAGGMLVLGLALAGAAALLAVWQAAGKRRTTGSGWWRLLGAPVDAQRARTAFADVIWNTLKGAAPMARPATPALGRRYAEVLQENLGQPGYRELIVVATDLDARRDIVAALLREPYYQEFMAPRPGYDRRAEVLDLAGVGREHLMDVIDAALTPPVIADPHSIAFAADGYWRGEVHRACDRPEAIGRLLEEVAAAGVTQAIIVAPVSASEGPHRLRVPRLDLRSRLGEFQSSAEVAALRDALEAAKQHFEAIFVISPAHNPVGPFDLAGAYDDASDRRQDLAELMERAYEDSYRQFIEPVVGASGEQIASRPA